MLHPGNDFLWGNENTTETVNVFLYNRVNFLIKANLYNG